MKVEAQTPGLPPTGRRLSRNVLTALMRTEDHKTESQ